MVVRHAADGRIDDFPMCKSTFFFTCMLLTALRAGSHVALKLSSMSVYCSPMLNAHFLPLIRLRYAQKYAHMLELIDQSGRCRDKIKKATTSEAGLFPSSSASNLARGTQMSKIGCVFIPRGLCPCRCTSAYYWLVQGTCSAGR